jgi:hypothetical protein
MRANIKLALSKLLSVAVLALLANVIKKMTGNSLFTTPPRTMAQLGDLRNELQDAIEDATGGSVLARKYRDSKVAEAKEVLRLVADYQRSVCGGDPAKLATGGFELSKRPEPVNEVGVPQRLVAAATDRAGHLRLRWGVTVGARVYRVEQANSDPTQGTTTWRSLGLTSRVSFDVSDLESYAANWFRIVAIGKASEGLPSDVVMGRAA